MTVYSKSGVSLPIRMVDGIPQCWCCSRPMIQPDPDRPDLWQCETYARDAALVSKLLGEAWARMADNLGVIAGET